jgi:hypothetical protein
MGGHLYVVLPAHGNHLLEKMRDTLPVIVGGNSTRLSYRQILPIVLELKSGVGDSTASLHLRVSPYWYYGPMMSDYLYAYLGSLLDISHDGLEPAVAFRARPQHDVFGVHSDRFQNEPRFVAIVFHSLELIEIPRAISRHIAHLRGEMLDAVA